MMTTRNNINQRCVGNFSSKIMQVLVPCLIFLAVENVQLVRNEHLDAQGVLDSTQFKNAVAKELLKKKLSNLESARQQDSLASFLKKGGRNTGLRTAPKSNFHKDDDPSRKQAQMANTFIASTNLLFGTKSQPRKSCNTAGKQANKEVLDVGSLRQLSGYNEDGSDFTALKESPKLTVLNESLSAVIKKRLFPRKAVQDPISCYLSEPKKVTCMHKDIIYKIALPSSDVADDEIGRIVESIYRAVEGKNSGRASLDEPMEGEVSQKVSLTGSSEAKGKKTASEDSLKKKRASDDYLKSVFLNSLLMANNKAALPTYNGNNPVFVPLLIPMAQSKPAGYYTGLAIDPRLQIPVNSSAGVDAFGHQTGSNVMFENGYGQFLVPDGLVLPELNLKQRSQANLTEEDEKRRNWLALMATNGLVPVDNKLMTQSLVHSPAEVQGITEEKDSLSNRNKLTVAETGEVLDKLLNKRQERDTYFVRRQLRRKSYSSEGNHVFSSFHNDERKNVLAKVVQKLSDPGDFITEEKKGCPCPCSTDLCATPSKCTRKSTKSSSKSPMKLIFQLTSPSVNTKCSSTTSCTTTPKCSTCPDGCQPIPSCPCESSTNKLCSTTMNCCGDSDILSRVVSGSSKDNEDPLESRQHLPLLPVQASHLNWLPYSPQLFQQNKLSYQSDLPKHMFHNDEKPQPYSSNENAPTEGHLESVAPVIRKQPQNAEQFQDGFTLQYSEKSNEPLENVQPFRVEDHNRFSPQNNIMGQNQIRLNNVQQPFGQSKNTESSTQDAINEPGARETPSNKDIELHIKPILQADHTNAASRLNDIKTKKHRDSFFARLRSKFHKGLSQNGTEFKKVATDGFQKNQYNRTVLAQNKGMIGTSIFKFSTKNQTSGFGKNNSSEYPLNKTCHTMDNERQCLTAQTNQSSDQTHTLVNQTQPSTVNNINITITSMQPQPLNNNQSNQPQPSNKNFVQCPISSSSTTQVSTSNGQNGRICTVTKIWLCSRESSTNIAVLPDNSTCGNVTQPPICPSVQTSTIETTTQPSTCRTQTTTNGSGPLQDSQRSLNAIIPQANTAFATGTPISRNGVTEAQFLQPQPSNQWPASSNHPTPRPNIQDIPQESPGSKFKTLYSPPPGWNPWQYPMDRMSNASPTERVPNLPQPSRMPLPPQVVPQTPQQKQLEQRPSPQMIGHLGNPAWHQNYMQPQNQLTWQQPPSQQLDPRWQAPITMGVPNDYQPNFQPSFQNRGDISNGYGQPIKSDIRYTQGSEIKPYDERKSVSNKTMELGMREPDSPTIIEQHIARIRRYLWKKRSKTSSHHLSKKNHKV